MSEINHTPGPWYVRDIDLHEGGKGVEVVTGDGEVICDNQTYYPQALDPRNAALIAAAPELLEALTELCDEIDRHEIHDAISKTSISWFKRKARKALANYHKRGGE